VKDYYCKKLSKIVNVDECYECYYDQPELRRHTSRLLCKRENVVNSKDNVLTN
jgi:hypothetical protein